MARVETDYPQIYDLINEKPQDKCGVTNYKSLIGKNVAPDIAIQQQKLQNRGYDQAGMSVVNSATGEIKTYTGDGYVYDVFPEGFDFKTHGLDGTIGQGHNRYGTSGLENNDSFDGAQPMVTQYKDRIVSVAFNGTIPESQREILKSRIPNDMPSMGDFDTADIVQAIAAAPGENNIELIRNAMADVDFAYVLALLIKNGDDPVEQFALINPTDTWQFWTQETPERLKGDSEIEKPANGDLTGIRKEKPGTLIQFTDEGIKRTQLFKPEIMARCTPQDVYTARRNSLMTEDGRTFGDFRRELGKRLANKKPIDADVYVGIPETGLDFARGFAEELGKETNQVIVKNEPKDPRDPYRSYIAKDVASAAAIIDGKFSIPENKRNRIKGKRIATFDDTLIKGASTGGYPLDLEHNDPLKQSRGYNDRLREAGATEIYNVFSMPKFIEGCDGGIVIKKDLLVALVKQADGSYIELNEEQIAERIGANKVVFNTREIIEQTYEDFLGESDAACMACVGKEHPLERIRKAREGNIFSFEDMQKGITIRELSLV